MLFSLGAGNADLIGRYRDLVDDGLVEDPEFKARIDAEREERMKQWEAERAANAASKPGTGT